MLNALRFVRGAVARKDYEPALTHFRIHGGRVLGYNGAIALSSPIDLDVDASPQAIPFVRAIERCTSETTVVHMTPAGKLSLRSGSFQAFVACHDDSQLLDSIAPEGEGAEFAGEALNAMRALEPFIGSDASRPWSNGVLLRGQSAFATNNVILVERWIGKELPEVNIPAAAVRELLRIGEEPIAAQISDRSITFYFDNDRWMRSQLLNTDWPEAVERILGQCDRGAAVEPPAGLFDAVETIAPFTEIDGRVYFRSDKVTTCGAGDDGATVMIDGVPPAGAFHYRHLLSLREIAQTIDLSQVAHERPCGFFGERLRGAAIGMRDA